MLKAATDEDDRPKPKSAKKESAAANLTATAVPVPAQRPVAPPITLNIFPGSVSVDKKDVEDSVAPSTTDEKPAPRRIAEASAQPRAALWAQPRIQTEGSGAASQVGRPSATETQPDP